MTDKTVTTDPYAGNNPMSPQSWGKQQPQTTKYWIITVRYSGSFCSLRHEGSLADHLCADVKQPIIFAHEITKEEYDKLEYVEMYDE